MNIFFVDHYPDDCAVALCDSHVVKMILETAQMLCTAHRIVLEDKPHLISTELYKITHVNHPCTKWVRESYANYQWTMEYWMELSLEYEHRFKKTHKTYNTLKNILVENPFGIDNDEPCTPIPLCMPDEYKTNDPIKSYRSYYRSKMHTMKRPMKWTSREPPDWFSS